MPPPAVQRRLPLPELALFALTIAWGLSFPVIKIALLDAGLFTLTWLRMSVGLGCLLLVRPRCLAASALEWRAGGLGGVLLAGGYLLQTGGLLDADSGKSGFLTAFYVPLVPLLEAAVYRVWPAARDLAALVLATAGIALMVVRADLTMSAGEGLVAASALCWAAQIVVVGRVAERVDPVRLAAVQLLVVATAAGVGAVLQEEAAVRWSGRLVGGILFLGIATNALGFLAQAWAQRRVPPTRTAILFSPEPVFAAIFGMWLLDEGFRNRDYAGAALVMIAVALAVWKPGNAAAARPPGS